MVTEKLLKKKFDQGGFTEENALKEHLKKTHSQRKKAPQIPVGQIQGKYGKPSEGSSGG